MCPLVPALSRPWCPSQRRVRPLTGSPRLFREASELPPALAKLSCLCLLVKGNLVVSARHTNDSHSSQLLTEPLYWYLSCSTAMHSTKGKKKKSRTSMPNSQPHAGHEFHMLGLECFKINTKFCSYVLDLHSL